MHAGCERETKELADHLTCRKHELGVHDGEILAALVWMEVDPLMGLGCLRPDVFVRLERDAILSFSSLLRPVFSSCLLFS